MCFLKRKFVIGTVGIFLPLFGIVGAFRLAKPDSAWARHRYGEEKLARARERYDTGRTGRFENWFVDLIGGKPGTPP